jgi:folate-dependent phosphoribosylglycinamide formyltransferase PurN
MKIVCLSNLSDTPGYLARQVVQHLPGVVLIRVQPAARRPLPPAQQLLSMVRGAWLRKLEYRWYYRGHYARGLERLNQLLYGSGGPDALAPAAVVSSRDMNRTSTAALFESFRPDVLLVAGAPVLKPRVFGIPRIAAINVHFGISPDYRGEHTLWWPMYRRDYGRIGVTIHLIDRGIDTGPALAQGFVAVEPDDDEWTVEAKAAQMAAELCVELLVAERFDPIHRPPRASSGRLFRYGERRIWHDAFLAVRRRCGERPPSIEPRRVKFCAEELEPATADVASAER